ncbi:permease-like cell division protein FtsX [Actinoplanes sp. NPDC026623]|uniref:permease-like cell division protein FtsX n=1 Tax=Actinoplanes sp. NPDC026623 TaxID=3155610 RepID=UPI0033F138F8
MRTLKIIVALLVAAAGLTACGLFGDDSGRSQDEQIQQILDENASFTVFLRDDSTKQQHDEVEAALRALPGFTGIVFEDHDAAYRKFQKAFSPMPTAFEDIDPQILPESFEVSMSDIAAVRKVRDTKSTVQSLPGVQDVTFPCLTVRECREMHSPKPTAPPS